MSERNLEKLKDLGVASYIKMHGVPVHEVNSKQVVFDVSDPAMRDRVKQLKNEYVNSQCATFDGWIATLKAMPQSRVDQINPSFQTVKSLGIAAFIKMKFGWRLIARVDRNSYVFFVPVEEEHEFEQAHIDWANSELRSFDSAMMQIKSGRLKRRD